MAVNVDTVYKTVLLITNKEQRGYLTPDEFNKIATQVQLEIIDDYLETINQQFRFPQNDTEYGNRLKNVQQKLDAFKTIGTCTFNAATATAPAYFAMPTSSNTPGGTQSFATSGTATAYPLTTITQADVEDSSVVVNIEIPTGAAGVTYDAANWNIVGGNFNANISGTPTPIGAGNTVNIVLYPNDFYKLGTVLYKSDREVQQIERNELALLNLSPISKPTEYFPVGIYENNTITIYPQTINADIQATYIRKPANPKWNFDSAAGYYVWDPVGSVNFELDKTEQTNIITKILFYAGVVIEDATVIDVAAAEIQKESQNSKS